MADKVLKGITCPSCSGELELREGVKSFNCKYCGTLLVTKGIDGVVKFYVPNKLQRNIAIQNAFNWLGHGLSKAKGLKSNSTVDDAFLVFIPYWRVRADVIGWVFGKERRTETINGSTREYYVDVEKKILQTYDRTYAACDVAELGVRRVSLAGEEMKPVSFDELQTEGMLFNIVSSQEDITKTAEQQFVDEAVSSASVDEVTFQHNDLVRPSVNIVYYPLWVVRYVYQKKTYQVVVDGAEGKICYGKAPGNNLYRAVTGIYGTAFGTFMITFFAAFGIVGGSSSGKIAIVIYIICVVLGIAAIRWAWKKFRYGGEIEEGTGIVPDTPQGKSLLKKAVATSTGARSFRAGDAAGIVADIFFDS